MSRRVGMTVEVKKSDEDKLLEGFMNPPADGAKPPDEDKLLEGFMNPPADGAKPPDEDKKSDSKDEK